VKRFWTGSEPPTNQPQPEWYWLPIGPTVGPGLYTNVFGDANALIKREVFEVLGGFKEIYGVGYEDWEFMGRAVLGGYDLQVVPPPLFWDRVHPESKLHTTDRMAARRVGIQPYLDHFQMNCAAC
jgi:O-antigen biosynthesis protein